jgi:hypothetical protein
MVLEDGVRGFLIVRREQRRRLIRIAGMTALTMARCSSPIGRDGNIFLIDSRR